MAIAFVDLVSSSTPAHPLSLNPGASAGEFLLWVGVNDNSTNVTFTNPSGFTQAADLFINSSDKGSLYVGYKANASGSEGSLDLSNSNSSSMIGFVLRFSGVDTTTPLDVAVVTNQNDTAASPPINIDANITPTTNGCEIVQVGISDVTSSDNASCAWATQSGTTGSWATRADVNSGYYNAHAGSANQTTAGALTVRFTSSGVASRAVGQVVLALRPASGGGGSSIAAIASYYRMLRSGT